MVAMVAPLPPGAPGASSGTVDDEIDDREAVEGVSEGL